MAMNTYFISDLHLSPETHKAYECFVHFIHTQAINADALYILGDFFDFWTADEDPSAFAKQIKTEIKQLTERGIPCYFIHGNRDFLLSTGFAQDTGITLLPEVSLIHLYGQPAVILHGDTLCTDDKPYQKFRKIVHNKTLQMIYRWLPFSLKHRLVKNIKQDVGQKKQRKTDEIMDVNQAAVLALFDHYRVDLMIHGHTHRPKIHRISSNQGEKTRIVLGDWDEHGSVLVVNKQGIKLSTLAFKSS